MDVMVVGQRRARRRWRRTSLSWQFWSVCVGVPLNQPFVMCNGNFNRWVLERRRKERIWEWNEVIWWRNDEEIEERSQEIWVAGRERKRRERRVFEF